MVDERADVPSWYETQAASVLASDSPMEKKAIMVFQLYKELVAQELAATVFRLGSAADQSGIPPPEAASEIIPALESMVRVVSVMAELGRREANRTCVGLMAGRLP